jgi:anti-sigma factor RsiW
VSDPATDAVTRLAPEDLACRDLIAMVTDYLDGVLAEPVATQVAGHLAICDGCEEYLTQFRGTISALGALPVATLDPAVRTQLLQAFQDFPHGGASVG